MKIKYIDKTFKPQSQRLIDLANQIITEYQAQGLGLTLRQLYYQFVSRDWLPESWADPDTRSTNNFRSYKKLGDIINDARYAGLVDWEAITDSGRNLAGDLRFNDPAHLMYNAVRWYKIDRWADHKYRPEVWVEKDALSGVVSVGAGRWDMPYFACKGYNSASEMWAAAQRFRKYNRQGQTPVILYLGDHDPSGLDMDGDIRRRMATFNADIEVRRLALTWEQIQLYNPPPNFAKITDSRADAYIEEFGENSWELDALNPSVIISLIEEAARGLREPDVFDKIMAEEAEGKEQLQAVADRWADVLEFIDNN